VKSRNYDCEINPEKLNGASPEANVGHLLELVQLFMDAIVEAAYWFPKVDTAVRLWTSNKSFSLGTSRGAPWVKRKGDDPFPWQSLLGYRRFCVPSLSLPRWVSSSLSFISSNGNIAIVAPEGFEIVDKSSPIDENTRRNLVLISKVTAF